MICIAVIIVVQKKIGEDDEVRRKNVDIYTLIWLFAKGKEKFLRFSLLAYLKTIFDGESRLFVVIISKRRV
jgi:hypothetical protein